MQFTKRDVEILKFINQFGFCEITQIEKQFVLKQARCYQILKRLKKANLVAHEKVFHGRGGALYLTKVGADFTDLPAIKNIPKDNYVHQITIIETYIKLMKGFPGSQWLTERHIARDKSEYGVGRKIRHLGDGILILPNNREIAIEVELTMKSKRRLDDIMLGYALHKHIKEVWYFCSPIIIERVRKAAKNWSHIKIFELD